MTQRQLVLKIIEEAETWVPSYDLIAKSTKYGWIGTEGGRRARELEEMGLIEKKQQGQYVYYKLKSREPQQMKML